MIDRFYEWFEGKFSNKIQAFSHPSKFAYIVVEHRAVNNHGLFYGEQAYFNQLNRPYRQFLLQISECHGKIIVRSMEPKDKSRYLGFKNLNLISGSPLTYKEDVIQYLSSLAITSEVLLNLDVNAMFHGVTKTHISKIMLY